MGRYKLNKLVGCKIKRPKEKQEPTTKLLNQIRSLFPQIRSLAKKRQYQKIANICTEYMFSHNSYFIALSSEYLNLAIKKGVALAHIIPPQKTLRFLTIIKEQIIPTHENKQIYLVFLLIISDVYRRMGKYEHALRPDKYK